MADVLGNPKYNATLEWVGRSTFGLVVTELGHGFTFISSESESRSRKTFYPKVRTSGEWYVSAQFYSYRKLGLDREGNQAVNVVSGYDAYMEFANWMSQYFAAITSPYVTTPKPLKLSVPSQGFTKSGFPKGSLSYGDEMGKFMYPARLSFSSASDPINLWGESSKFIPATNSSVARHYYPGGFQAGDLLVPGEGELYPVAPPLYTNFIDFQG